MILASALKQIGGALLLAVVANGAGFVDLSFAQEAFDPAESTGHVLFVPKDCRSPRCTAKKQLYDAFDIIFDRNKPNPGTYIHPEQFNGRKFLAEHERRVQHLLTSNRKRWPWFCEDVAQVAAHYQNSDIEWGYVAVELAGRLSSPSLDCAAQVINAFPPSPEVGRVLADAAQICHGDHHPGCAYVDRAIAARNARLAP